MAQLGTIFRLALISSLALGAAAKADTPAATPAAASAGLTALETMVQNLGYTTTEASDKQSFFFVWTSQAQYDYKIHLSLSHDGTMAFAYVGLGNLTAAQLTKLQYAKLLEADDSGDFYFSMEPNGTGEWLYGNAILAAKGLKPQSLRSTLQDMASDLDSADNLWDTSTWK